MLLRMYRQFAAFFLCVALCPVLEFGCSRAQSEAPRFSGPLARTGNDGSIKLGADSMRFIEVAAVSDGAAPALVRAPARIAFRDAAVAKVGAPVHGRVAAIAVHVGDHVRKGDRLLTLISPDAAGIEADLQRADVAERTAATEAQRQRLMMDKGVGIRSELVVAEAHWQEAKVELARARTGAAFLGRGASGNVDVRAPIEGEVLALHGTLGATAQPDGDPLVEIGDPNDLWAVTEVFERELPLVRVGGSATAEVASLSTPAKLHVISVGAQVDTATRRAPVYLSFDRRDPSLRAGMFARVSVEASAGADVSVPATAVLVKEGGRTIVYVAQQDGSFVAREVTVGHPVDGQVPVLGGLQRGQRVVVRGALLLDSAAEQLS